jgi:hypothetical protein
MSGSELLEGIEQLGDSFGSAELACVEESRSSPGVDPSDVEEVVPESGTNHMSPFGVDAETLHELLGMTAVEDEETVVTPCSRAYLVGEVGAKFHLPEAGCVTVADNPSAGGDILEQRRNDPQVVRVDEMRSKRANNRPQMLDPGSTVGVDTVLAERGEPGARVGHDVAHSGNREIEGR